jgi:mannose-6-phosphate isomerase-like protein (cupin superfamily)
VGTTVHGPGEGEVYALGPSRLELKATSENTDGRFFLSESTIGPGFPGPPLHIHETLHDMFYVLEGTLSVQLGDETLEAKPGTFVCVPPGTPHTFSNRSEEPVRFLNFNVPGGFERYMRDLAAAMKERGGQLESAEIGAIAARYDFRPV